MELLREVSNILDFPPSTNKEEIVSNIVLTSSVSILLSIDDFEISSSNPSTIKGIFPCSIWCVTKSEDNFENFRSISVNNT